MLAVAKLKLKCLTLAIEAVAEYEAIGLVAALVQLGDLLRPLLDPDFAPLPAASSPPTSTPSSRRTS